MKSISSLSLLLLSNLLGVYSLPFPQELQDGYRTSPSGRNNKANCTTKFNPTTKRYTAACKINPSLLFFKNKNILWLKPPKIDAIIDIPITNYKIDEWILAQFKNETIKGPTINVSVQKPVIDVAAQAQDVPDVQLEPEVNVEYEAISNSSIHFPSKPYASTTHKWETEPTTGRPGYNYPNPQRRDYRHTFTITEEVDEDDGEKERFETITSFDQEKLE